MGIGNKLVFDVNGNVEDFTFILSTKDLKHLGAIQNVVPESVHNSGNLVNGNEISFEVYKVVEKEIDDEVKDVEEPLWDDITNLKLVYVRELDEYFEMNVQLDDTTEVIKKTVTCTSLHKAELGQIYIRGLEVNTETDISRDDYEPTIFYNEEDPKASLLDRVFSFAPHYKIMHVDESLKKLQRTFSVDEAVMDDWLTGECASEFNCLFQFDSTSRGVYVYDLYTVCKDCGHRGDYIDECPECGSTDLDYFGEDATIFIDKENLTNAVQLTTDVGAIKNCFYLEAGDELITSIVRLLNMNGTGYLFFPTDAQLAEMPEELRNKIVSYNKKYLAKKDEYEGIIANLFETKAEIDRLTHTMMPTIEHADITAQTEADKLTAINLDPLGLSAITTSTSKATVESALINYAKVYINPGYVKLDISQSEFTYVGVDSDGWNYGTWTGNFKVTNYSDEEDVAYSDVITITVTENYQSFLEQRIMKNILNNNDEDNSVFDVLAIDELDDFRDALKLYCSVRLESFCDAIQSALDVLLEVDQANESADLYKPLYLPYYEKLQACQEELDVRQAEIDTLQNTYDNYEMRRQEIQADLNFEDYLGVDLYKVFCMYRREDTYRNENYISDGLSDSEQIQKARDFIEVAKKELQKARTPIHSIATTLYNLLLIPEFKPLLDYFKLGNWLRICVDDIIYRLRLIGYNLSFSSIQTLSVEFATVTKLNTVANETKDILDSAKSMASNFDYFVAQAKKGNEANVEINRWLEDGLESGLVNIKNNNNEDPVMDKHGFWGRAYDSETGNILPEQFRATHNILGFTDNNWLSTTCALGKHNYYKFDAQGNLVQDTAYGLTSQFVTAGYIYGSQIISGDIYSENYKLDSEGSVIQGSHLSLKDGSFSFGGSSLRYDPINGLFVNGNITSGSTITGSKIIGGSIEIGKNFTVDEEGNVVGVNSHFTNGTFTGTITTDNLTATGGIIGGWYIIDGVLYDYDGTINTMGAGMQSGQYDYSSEIQNADISFWAGAPFKNRYLAPFLVKVDGSVTANSLTTNNITATGGVIGGCTIKDGVLQIGNVNIREKLTADSIDATNLKVTAANVTGTLTASQIDATDLKVSAANVTGQLTASQINTTGLIAENISGTTITGKTISGGQINIGNGVFTVSTTGAMKCTSATITGVLTASSGSSLGGFKTDSNSIYYGSWGSAPPSVFMCTGSSTKYSLGGSPSTNGWCFGAGSNFGVTNTGAMYARSGKIGDWYLGYKSVTVDGVTKSGYALYSGTTNNVFLFPDGVAYYDGSVEYYASWARILAKAQ